MYSEVPSPTRRSKLALLLISPYAFECHSARQDPGGSNEPSRSHAEQTPEGNDTLVRGAHLG
jgi:hypothetical protein